MKILSVIIPAYNCRQFLDKCVGSFLEESVLEKLDIIIVNDGSTDGTAEAAQGYCGRFPGSVRLISQENKGHGGALNTGCAAAAGKYLKVVDADDWVETRNLPAFLDFLENCESDVVLTHHYTVDISTGEVKKWKSYPEGFGTPFSMEQIMGQWKNFDRSLTFHGITYNTAFYRRNGIRLSEHVFYEDHEFATIPCCYARTVTPLDLFLYDYRIGDTQQSVSDANQLRRLSHIEAVLQRLMTEFERLHLDGDSAGREYYCMKVQGLLLSYMTTVLLVEPDRKKGRRQGAEMMELVRRRMPRTYELAVRQYRIFRGMNRLHVSKASWEKILRSKGYHLLRRDHEFK